MNALLIIANKNFRDEEFFITKEELEKNKMNLVIASSEIKESKGMFGKTITPNILLKDADAKNYDAIIFIGGSGTSEYFNNETALNLAKSAYKENKIVAAICIAPVILANAGILKGKRATVSESLANKITSKGAKYVDEDFVVDGKIITADGPSASRAFVREIIKALKK
jgi:protease I